MMIEIYGAGFGNKGAQLMLLTVLKEMGRAAPALKFCMSPAKDAAYAERARYGLQHTFPIPRAKDLRNFPLRLLANKALGALIPKNICQTYGLARNQDVDALVDVSGFAFGDANSHYRMRNNVLIAQLYRQRGKPVIMLPQMFGPFEKPAAAESFRQLLRHANLVFARDVKSLDYARATGGPTENLYLAPDITIFMESDSDDQSARVNESYACLVPNVRTPRNGHPRWREVYVDRMAEVGRLLARQGVKPYLLMHSIAGEDHPLANQIKESIGENQCEIVTLSDPLAIKSFIAHSRLIVASRYHSVVGALSSGVPAIVLGWAHKYDTLLDDFNVPDLIHHATDTKEHLLELVNALLDESEWARRRDILLAAKSRMVAANQLMWQQVNETLGLNAQSLTP